MPGLETSFSQPIATTYWKAFRKLTGRLLSKSTVTIWPRCVPLVNSIVEQISSVPGVSRAFIDRDGDLPQQIIDIDRDAAARYGINIGDIQDTVEAALAARPPRSYGRASGIFPWWYA